MFSILALLGLPLDSEVIGEVSDQGWAYYLLEQIELNSSIGVLVIRLETDPQCTVPPGDEV